MGKNTTEDGAFDQAVASLDGILRSRAPGQGSPGQGVPSQRRSWRLGLVVAVLIVMLGIAALAGVDGARRWATRSLQAGTSTLFGDRVTVSLPPADRAFPRVAHDPASRGAPVPASGSPAGADQPVQPTPTPLPTARAVAEVADPPPASRDARQRRRRMTAAATPPSDPAEQADSDNEDEGNATTKRQTDEAERRAAIDAIRALRLR